MKLLSRISYKEYICTQCFFVTVRAGTAYRKIWRLVNNFFAPIIRFTVQKFQLFWVIFCIIIFFIELWHILILWLATMPNGGMPVFTLIATGWRYRKIFFYKKALFVLQHWKWPVEGTSTVPVVSAHCRSLCPARRCAALVKHNSRFATAHA